MSWEIEADRALRIWWARWPVKNGKREDAWLFVLERVDGLWYGHYCFDRTDDPLPESVICGYPNRGDLLLALQRHYIPHTVRPKMEAEA